ncbi:MAG: LEA protein [Actinobacteria bacterium]|nr:LEA protein [Actinomycetota bacterium]
MIALLAASFAAAGCRPLMKDAFKTPKIRITDVSLASNPFNDQKGPWRFTLTLEVDNPNDYPLDVARVAYSVTLGRETVAEGDHIEDIRIEASRATVVKVPLSLRPDALLSSVRRVLQTRNLDYELNGSVALQAPFVGLVRVPFSKAGNVDPVDLLKKKPLGFN